MVAELDGQPVHTSAPVAALNVSAAHATGVPPFAPVYPADATQAVFAVAALLDPVIRQPSVPGPNEDVREMLSPTTLDDVSNRFQYSMPPVDDTVSVRRPSRFVRATC